MLPLMCISFSFSNLLALSMLAIHTTPSKQTPKQQNCLSTEFPFGNLPGYSGQLQCAKGARISWAKTAARPQNACAHRTISCPGGEGYMATCLPQDCPASQTASSQTVAQSVFSAHFTLKCFADPGKRYDFDKQYE